MKKNLLLYILLAFLVVMNGVFLFKHFGKNEKMVQQRGAPSSFLAKQLELDAEQTAQFKKLEAQHRANMDAMLMGIKSSKKVLFDKSWDKNASSPEIDSIVNIIGRKEASKELEILRFFKGIDGICNEDQKERFRLIIKDALHQPRGREGGGPPPPGGHGPGGENGPPPPPDSRH